MKTGRPAPFPSPIENAVKELAPAHEEMPPPDEARRKIGIPK